VTLNRLEQVDQPPGGGPAARAAFGVHRQRLDRFPLHRLSQFAFQQRLDH